MNTLRNRLGTTELLLVMVVSALAGCGTAQNRAPTAAANVASAPEAAPPTVQKADSTPPTMRPRTSPVAASTSTQANTALVLRQIHETNLTEIALGRMAQEKASTDEVRAYADQLVQDHTNVD